MHDHARTLIPTAETRVLLSSAGRGWQHLDAEFLSIPRGRHHVPGGRMHRLGIHMGTPVNADCRCDGGRSRRVQKHGDIDIIPAGLDGSWEDDATCTILRLSLAPALIDEVAEGRSFSMRPLLQLRDPRIEAIGLAIKAELEAEHPTDPLYGQSLGVALASRLLALHDAPMSSEDRLSPRQRRLLRDYIEAHLDRTLSLAELAGVAGIGLSQFKLLFPRSFGQPAHRYVIARRVERAHALMLQGGMAPSEIALAAGFAHQSHMAAWMRRLIGETPRQILRRGR